MGGRHVCASAGPAHPAHSLAAQLQARQRSHLGLISLDAGADSWAGAADSCRAGQQPLCVLLVCVSSRRAEFGADQLVGGPLPLKPTATRGVMQRAGPTHPVWAQPVPGGAMWGPCPAPDREVVPPCWTQEENQRNWGWVTTWDSP